LVRTFNRNRTTWLAYFMLAFYSYFLNIFGPITPFLKNELKLTYTVSSLHFSAFALGMIGAGLLSSQVIQRIGRWNALWLGAFGMSLSAILLMIGQDRVVTIGASFIMGLIGSLILTVIPSVLSDQYGDLRAVAFSEANVIASLLSTIAPVLVGWFAPTVLGWRMPLVLAAVSVLAMRFGFWTVRLPAPKNTDSADEASQRLPRLYWIYWVAIVLAVSAEFCMIFWSADYLETVLGMAKADAAQAVSLFLGGMIIGRLLGSWLVQRFRTHQVVTAALVVATIGFVIYWQASGPNTGMVGLGITGLGIASMYPLILSLAVGSAKGSAVRASARSSLASGVAIFTLPLILGRLADAIGIRSAYAIVLVLLIAEFVIILGTMRSAMRRRQI